MKGYLEICYHKGDGVQNTKELAKINTISPDKSFHINFEMGGKYYEISIYHDCFGVDRFLDESFEERERLFFEDGEGEENLSISSASFSS